MYDYYIVKTITETDWAEEAECYPATDPVASVAK